MFYYISGPLAYKESSIAVIDASGVGYKMTVSQTTYDALPAVGNNTKLFTHLSVREDGIELFGFATNEELSAFRLLITVSGIGPKVALSVLSFLTPDKFALAVASEDKKLLAKANGVGAKTAARIILELKDKLAALGGGSSVSATEDADNSYNTGETSELGDAIEALLALGYSKPEIALALRGVDTANMSLEDIFRTATKRLMK